MAVRDDARTTRRIPPESRAGTIVALTVAAVSALLAAVIGFWHLGITQVWVDEPVYARAGVSYLAGDTTPNPEHPPLAKLIMGVSQLVLGDGVASVRVLMGVVTLLTAVAIWWFASRIVGWRWAVAPAGMWVLMSTPSRAGTAWTAW